MSKFTQAIAADNGIDDKIQDWKDYWYCWIPSQKKVYCRKLDTFMSMWEYTIVLTNTHRFPNYEKKDKELIANLKWSMLESKDFLSFGKEDKEWCFNMCQKDFLLKHSDTPELHEDLSILFNSLWNGKEENIEHIEKTILYKYLYPDDPLLPCIIFHWWQWSWKWTLMEVFKKMFSKKYVSTDLWMKDILRDFSVNDWKQFVIEFSEISTNNTANDSKVADILKWSIWAQDVNVNQKWVQQISVDNVALYIISSNRKNPLQLEQWSSNRRYAVMNSERSIRDVGRRINNTIKNTDAVSNLLAYLLVKYPDMKKGTPPELDNEDKRNLVDTNKSDYDFFWEEIHHDNESWTKISIKTINNKITEYCDSEWIDERQFKKFFWHESPYIRKSIKEGWIVFKWIIIKK